MSAQKHLRDMAALYPNFKINPSKLSGDLKLDAHVLKVDTYAKPEDWKVLDSATGNFLTVAEVKGSEKLAMAEFIETYKDIDEDIEGNVQEAPVKVHVEPENKPGEIIQEPNQDNWVVPTPKSRTQEIESVNLPAPVGINGIVRPAVTAVEALAAWKEFQELKKYIIEKSDIQMIQGKPHIKKSGWRKFATFYNLTDEIVEEKEIPLDKGGYYWKIKVICTAPNGRRTEGVGMCASAEKSGARQIHDVYTTAHTRAKNRAISDMIAAGEVSAEEMEA